LRVSLFHFQMGNSLSGRESLFSPGGWLLCFCNSDIGTTAAMYLLYISFTSGSCCLHLILFPSLGDRTSVIGSGRAAAKRFPWFFLLTPFLRECLQLFARFRWGLRPRIKSPKLFAYSHLEHQRWPKLLIMLDVTLLIQFRGFSCSRLLASQAKNSRDFDPPSHTGLSLWFVTPHYRRVAE
jgi:hypothetical protein